MSRIDAALERAQARPASAMTLPVADGDVFTSAWHGTGAAPAPSLRAAAVSVEPAPVEHGPMLVQVAGGAVPSIGGRFKERIAASADCSPQLLEQFRRLAGTLHNAQVANGIRVVLVSSASPGEGKTLTAINLALVLSQSYGRRVLLIDADLRRPSIGEVVDVSGSVGLSAALRAKQDAKLAVIPLSPTLTLLPAGPADPDPLSGLTSRRMKDIIEEASNRFDWVIMDGPPIGPLADAGLLAQIVEGTLLVVRAGKTSHAAAEKAVAAIGRERILGVVLNGVASEAFDGYGPYYSGDQSPKVN